MTENNQQPTEREPIRVLVVDDQELFRRGLTMLLGVEPGIEVVGEASSRLLKTKFGSGNPELRTELRQASDMRNRLTHGYPGVDLAILWSTARQFVPALVQRVRTAFVEYDGRD